MKKGIIIICNKNDLDILKEIRFKSLFNKEFKICIVNNGNNNKILNFLLKLNESSKFDISILNLRKEKALKLAMKAGVRFLSNLYDVQLFVHTTPKSVFKNNLKKKLESIKDENFINKKNERVLLRSVYSLNEITS
ncbi:hypothetical protein BTO15_16730 [Polaribacter sejongensis]|uniref:Glycosyltransferase 2-like domain-containing protein n=1 Tax=Polaribacter sejongensis TaxID=985043 RepID=A0ABM6Q370_9FLAO|nr:hypothetical protein [Polaribacter sejongensis]AUC23637.1 hypothetical protein BTO15_16730 [Polaribacter sejongensis]